MEKKIDIKVELSRAEAHESLICTHTFTICENFGDTDVRSKINRNFLVVRLTRGGRGTGMGGGPR